MRKEIGQRALAARQQSVQMPGLRRAPSRHSLIRQAVTLQHGHPFKKSATAPAAAKPAMPAPITTACLPIFLAAIAVADIAPLLIHAALPAMRGRTRYGVISAGTNRLTIVAPQGYGWLRRSQAPRQGRFIAVGNQPLRLLMLLDRSPLRIRHSVRAIALTNNGFRKSRPHG